MTSKQPKTPTEILLAALHKYSVFIHAPNSDEYSDMAVEAREAGLSSTEYGERLWREVMAALYAMRTETNRTRAAGVWRLGFGGSSHDK